MSALPCYCRRCQHHRRLHAEPRVLSELQATAARGRSSFEFELRLRPEDYPPDRPPEGASPEDCDSFAARQLQLWLNRCRQGSGQGLRFHAIVERLPDSTTRRIVAVLHEGSARAEPELMLRSFPGTGAWRVVGPDDADALRVFPGVNACQVVKHRASLHYGQPHLAPQRRTKQRVRRELQPGWWQKSARKPARRLFGTVSEPATTLPAKRRDAS